LRLSSNSEPVMAVDKAHRSAQTVTPNAAGILPTRTTGSSICTLIAAAVLTLQPLAPSAGAAGSVQVHLPTAAGLQKTLEEATRAVRSSRYERAATLITEFLRRNRGAFASEDGVFLPAAKVLWRRVALWPAESLRHLARQIENQAAEAFEPLKYSTDIGALRAVVSQYFPTTAAAKAAERAIRLAIEADMPLLALTWLQELTHHPARNANEEKWKQLTQICNELCRNMLARGPVRAEPSSVSTAGTTSSQPAGRSPAAATQPLPFRTHRDSDRLKPLKNLKRLQILWKRIPTESVLKPADGGVQRFHRIWPISASLLPNGTLIVQWARGCEAWDAVSGGVIWRYLAMQTRQAYLAGAGGTVPFRMPASDDGRIYFVTEILDPDQSPPRAVHAIICVDARDGRRTWIRTASPMDSRTQPCWFDGRPVVSRGKVLLLARSLLTSRQQVLNLLVLDAESGSLLRRFELCKVARASALPSALYEPAAILESGGIIYICESSGTVIAVDSVTGRIMWLLPDDLPTQRDLAKQNLAVRLSSLPVLLGPLWLKGRPIIVRIVKGSLRVIDCITGRIVNEITPSEPSTSARLVRCDEPGALLLGRGSLTLLSLPELTEKWKTPLASQRASAVAMTVCDPDVLVAVTGGLYRIDIADETVKERLDLPLSDVQQIFVDDAGALLVGRFQVQRLTWGNAACSGAKLQDSHRPADPARLMRLAETLSYRQDREIDTILKWLRLALQRQEDLRGRRSEAMRRRAFETIMRLADGLSADDERSRPALEKLLNEAKKLAPSADAYMTCCERLARLYVDSGSPEKAVELWQQVIENEVATDAAPGPQRSSPQETPIAVRAAGAINALIRQYGRQIYAKFDTQILSALKSQRIRNDPKQLAGLLRTHPGTRYRQLVLLYLGKSLLRQARPLEALGPLRQVVLEDLHDESIPPPAPQQSAAATTAGLGELNSVKPGEEAACLVAEIYAREGRKQDAAVWRRLSGGPAHRRRHGQGTADTASQRADRRHTAEAKRDLPEVSAIRTRQFDSPVHLFAPQEERRRRLPERLVVSDGRRIMTLTAGDLKTLWSAEDAALAARDLLLIDDEQIVLAGRYALVSLDSRSGKVRWRWLSEPPERSSRQVDPETLRCVRKTMVAGERIVVTTNRNEIICIDAQNGAVAWQVRLPLPLSANAVVTPHTVTCMVGKPTRPRMRTLSLQDGSASADWQTAIDGTVEEMLLLPGEFLLLIGPYRSRVFDPFSGRKISEIAARASVIESPVRADGKLLLYDRISGKCLLFDLLTGRGLAERPLRLEARERLIALRRTAQYTVAVTSTGIRLLNIRKNDIPVMATFPPSKNPPLSIIGAKWRDHDAIYVLAEAKTSQHQFYIFVLPAVDGATATRPGRYRQIALPIREAPSAWLLEGDFIAVASGKTLVTIALKRPSSAAHRSEIKSSYRTRAAQAQLKRS